MIWPLSAAIRLLILCAFLFCSQVMASDDQGADISNSPHHELPLTALNPQFWFFDDGVAGNQLLRIEGENTSDTPARLLLRIDHHSSVNYRTRFNLERVYPTGRFILEVPLNQLKTSAGETFTHQDIRKIYLSNMGADFRWHAAALLHQPLIPAGLIGWDFGPDAQTSVPGMIQVSQTDVRQGFIVEGPYRYRNRPYHDPMIADGIEGLTRLVLPIKNGLWRIRLWSSDIGEWEYVPHALEKSIQINQTRILQQNLSYQDWLTRFYLYKPDISQGSSGLDAFWQSVGQYRGAPVDGTVLVTDGKLTLDFSSPETAGRFISALIAVPLNTASIDNNVSEPLSVQQNPEQFDQFDQYRENIFQRSWSYLPNPELYKNVPEIYQGESLLWVPGENISLRLDFPDAPGQLKELDLPLKNLQIYQIRQGYSRPRGQEMALQNELSLIPLMPESYAENMHQPRNQSVADYAINAEQGDQWVITGQVEAPLAISETSRGYYLRFDRALYSVNAQLLPVILPEVKKPIGIYLDYAPHLSWFSQQDAETQASCDYHFLSQFGLTGVAPALPDPVRGKEEAFKRAVQSPLNAGLLPPYPAYTPVKRLLPNGQDYTLEQLDKVSSVAGLLLWSLADEPGLFLREDLELDQFNNLMAASRPEFDRMAQLNRKEHDKTTDRFNSVLVNHGYQLTAERIQQLKQSNLDVYLYNLPSPRFAAGAYLWKTGLKGYWQWHGRMPTAHPADPTDGRENDVQLLFPSAQLCRAPEIHPRLLAIRQGVNDLRWLNWLMQNANQNLSFAMLQHELQKQIDSDWEKNTLNNKVLDRFIDQIKRLAQGLQSNH
ncbi:hypothetical protein [Oceanospirillum sediminis]|uniref:Glycoside hydrolase 123 C-terminal domain-containing protein n=1 Tax=Oceanospirillum sediminis TaxID=2760088 RepID=A0A839IS80_9GAMM|nr:hypothetical protein [Oceanospirillum sediminis]MBB1487339.1 hypothetical protein [Oceanospirillum sediminis]